MRVLPQKCPFLARICIHQNGLFWKSSILARVADIHQPFLRGLARLADNRQRPFVKKNVTRLAKFARVLSESRKFGASGHCLNVTQLATYHNYLTYIAYLDFQA